MLDLLEERGIKVLVSTHGRVYDPANPRDRRSLLEDAVDSEYESAKTSTRGRRTAAAQAAKGKPHGRLGFGWTRLYDPKTRELVEQLHHPDEAPLIEELFKRLDAGVSFRAIAADWEARDIVNDSGTPFSPQHLRRLAINPAYAGLREHNPNRRGKRPDAGPATLVDATWTGIVSKALYYRVFKKITDPERHTSRDGRARHLLSRIARCDPCGAFLIIIRAQKPKPLYSCQKHGCASIGEAALDEWATDVIVGWLMRDDVATWLRRSGEAEDEALAKIADKLAEARAELAKLRAALKSGAMSVETGMIVEPGLVERVKNLEQDEKDATTPSVLRPLVGLGERTFEAWEDTPIEAKRDVARTLFVPEILGELRLKPNPVRYQVAPVEDRVTTRKVDV
ncbi:recombinase family protein [Amycolatopsis sp. Hca4]|nr:recombinase family protein [Amycolatopsis sp. Hca4]